MAKTVLLAFELLLGCRHRDLGRPFTLSGWTYEVCLKCGKKLAYDRADIGCVVAQRKNLGRSESSQEGYVSISFVLPQQQERVKVAWESRCVPCLSRRSRWLRGRRRELVLSGGIDGGGHD